MKAIKMLMFWCLIVVSLAGCSTFDEGGLLEKPRKLLDKATPTESARARRAGFADNKKIYFITEVDGLRKSTGYRVRNDDTTYNQVSARLLETYQRFDLVSKQGYRVSQDLQRKTIVANGDGRALYLSERIDTGEGVVTKSISVYGGIAKFIENSEQGNSEDEIEVPEDVMFGIDSVWLARQNPDIGDIFERRVIDRIEKKVFTEKAVIRNIYSDKILGVEMEVYEAEITRGDFSPIRIVFNKNGDLLRQQADNMVSFVVSESVASRDEAKIVATSSIPVDFQLPAWDNFNRMLLAPEPLGSWKEYLKESDYVSIDGDNITLNRVAPNAASTEFPIRSTAEMKDYLVEAEDIIVDDGDISGLARDIIGSENNAVNVVALLAGWVYQNIAYDPGQGRNVNALETLQKRSGDHGAHSALFASLARSVGIPTRICVGLLIQRGKGIYHSWSEAWINGTWLPVDTTVNRVGLPAGYMLTARGHGKGDPKDSFAWAVRDGNLSLKFISATKIHRNPANPSADPVEFTLYPDEKKSYVAIASDWLANIYWGFALYKPENWQGKIALQAVTINSDNKDAVFKIEALNKVLPCTESQLDMIISSLEKSLAGFHLINKGRVYFGKRNDNSLFIDFSVTQNGLRRRCRMYVIPKRGRSYRVTAWAPFDDYDRWAEEFDKIVENVEL